jgi:hypothetical protein
VVKKYQSRMTQAKARSVARKKVIVAMARLIGVDLWRLSSSIFFGDFEGEDELIWEWLDAARCAYIQPI